MDSAKTPEEIKLWLDVFAATAGAPLHILCGKGRQGDGLPQWWSGCPKPMTAHVRARICTKHGDGKPAFHDRYLITPKQEVLITHSVNGWADAGVTFASLPYGVYRAEAERSHGNRHWLRPEMQERVAAVILDGIGPTDQSETAVWAIGSINAELAASKIRSNWSSSAIDGFVHATLRTLKTACDRNKVLDASRSFGLDLDSANAGIPGDAFARERGVGTFQHLLNHESWSSLRRQWIAPCRWESDSADGGTASGSPRPPGRET